MTRGGRCSARSSPTTANGRRCWRTCPTEGSGPNRANSCGYPPGVIRLEDVTKRYDGGTVAVDGLSFEVADGEICVLVGPSGCGKTTTMRMVNRLIEPTSGHIYIDDEAVQTGRASCRERVCQYV